MSSPRQRPSQRFVRTLLALVLSVSALHSAPPSSAQTRRAPASRDTKAAREERERRRAVALVREAAASARGFSEAGPRAVALALAADLLWPFDEPAARQTLQEAWRAATDADIEMRDKGDEGRAPGEKPGQISVVRWDVIAVAGRHDAQLADKLMADLAGEEADSVRGEVESREWLADLLLWRGDYSAAARTALPLAAGGVSPELMRFLHELRRRSPADADDLFARLLAATAADARADARAVLSLSSYVVSPGLLVVLGDDGSVSLRSLDPRPSAASADGEAHTSTAPLRAHFFRTAASILLRPAPAEKASASFFVIARLLPHFEREAPRYAAQLRARQAALAAEIDAARRERLAEQAGLQSLTAKNPADPLGPLLDSIAGTQDEAERDRRRVALVTTAARRRLWGRAASVAAEIKDEGLRRAALSVITEQKVLTVGEAFREDVAEDDWERALNFVREADVSPLVRTLGLAQAARLAARRNRKESAAEIITEAAGMAEQTGHGTAERLGARAALAVTALSLGQADGWRLLTAAVNGANELNDPEEIFMFLFTEREGVAEPDDDPLHRAPGLGAVFAAAGRADLARAAGEARTLNDEAARAFALLSAAGARLEASPGGVRAKGEKK